jgi:hypothetical protein
MRFRHHLYSSHIPGLAQTLLSMLPSLREHDCINRRNLSFEEELTQTELGHVFEHIILELLSLRGICTRGQTTWNWERDPIGTYHITINTGKKLLLKESLLVAQAILTNALLGPVLRMRVPEAAPKPAASAELPVYRYETAASSRKPRPDRMLFAATPIEPSAPAAASAD